ncbi:TPA: Gfo/Idh/MocA family oxidoreductase, partial [Candidatus Bathyarchaeota archaeon]|nr:Gfo/Idh/MocA family oxidoreductase [Candidatus Bathyarchaeota archaeon]
LRYVTDRAELVAVCDLKEDLAKRNARWFGFKRWYTNVDQFLKQESLDAVFIVGPPTMQTDLGIRCLKLGLHVFVEKPPSICVEEAKRFLEASKKTGRNVMIGFMKRFALGYKLAKKIIQSPEFGRPVHIVTKFANGPYGSRWGIRPPSRAYLIGQAVHHFDLVRYFIGEVKEVYARLYETSVEEKFSYSVLLIFDEGRTGVMSLNSCQSWSKIDEYVEITGNEAFIFIDDMATQVRYYPKTDWIEIDMPRGINVGNFWEINHLPSRWNQSRYIRGYCGEVEHFVDSILENKTPSPNLEDGLKALKIAESVWESVQTLSRVKLQ